MSTKIFVNLPVKDLDKSKVFYTALGYAVNEQFTDENASCVVVDETIHVMLLTEPFFKTFTPKEIVDATQGTETIVALGVDSKAQVDDLVDKAFAAGGTVTNEPNDQGFMYGRSFADLDGHLWEVIWMDPAAIQG